MSLIVLRRKTQATRSASHPNHIGFALSANPHPMRHCRCASTVKKVISTTSASDYSTRIAATVINDDWRRRQSAPPTGSNNCVVTKPGETLRHLHQSEYVSRRAIANDC